MQTQPNSNQPDSDQKVTLTALPAQFRAQIKQTYQTAASWVAQNKRALLWAAVAVALALVYTVIFIYLWRRSPAFRAVVKALAREMVSLPANLWANVMRIRADVWQRMIEETRDGGASGVLVVEELPAEEIPAHPVLDGREAIAA